MLRSTLKLRNGYRSKRAHHISQRFSFSTTGTPQSTASKVTRWVKICVAAGLSVAAIYGVGSYYWITVAPVNAELVKAIKDGQEQLSNQKEQGTVDHLNQEASVSSQDKEVNNEPPSEEHPVQSQEIRDNQGRDIQSPNSTEQEVAPDASSKQQTEPSSLKLYSQETEQFVNKYLASLPHIKLQPIDYSVAFEPGVTDVIIAVPIIFNENAVKAIAGLLNRMPSTGDHRLTVFYKIIEQTQDFEDVKRHTGIDFRANDNIFNTIAIRHEHLDQYKIYRLSDIINPDKKILKDFTPIQVIRKSAELKDLVERLESDEIVIGLCAASDSVAKKKFGELLFQNPGVNISKVTPIQISENKLFAPCKNNSAFVMLKSDADKTDTITTNKNNKNLLMLGDLNGKTIESITHEIGDFINHRWVFKNSIVKSAPKPFQLEFTIDRNLHDSREINRIRLICKSVKEKLAEQGQQFDFVLVSRSLHNSEKDRRPIVGYDVGLIQKQMSYMYQNTDASQMKKLLEEDSRVGNIAEQGFLYPFPSITTANILAFCEQIRQGAATPARFSQKMPEFQKYSHRIVGQNFKSAILDNPLSQIIFYYSKNCGSCKKFMPFYEELALENLKNPASSTSFNRINNDENQNPHQETYVSTPKIIIYKGEHKEKPYQYRSNRLSKDILRQFINTTLSFELLYLGDRYEEFIQGARSYLDELRNADFAVM